MKSTFFIEQLTVSNWFFRVLPCVVRERGKNVYIIDASPLAFKCAKATAKWMGISFGKLDFRLVDIKDDAGVLMRLKIAFFDMNEVCDEIVREPLFQDFLRQFERCDRLPKFLEKNVALMSLQNRQVLWRALFLVHVARWQMKQKNKEFNQANLFLKNRSWASNIKKYGEKNGIHVHFLQGSFWRNWNFKWEWLRHLHHIVSHARWSWKNKSLKNLFSSNQSTFSECNSKVGIEYYGQLNLNCSELHSDLFFLKESNLEGKDLSVIFHLSNDPLDNKKMSELKKYGINAVAVTPAATTVASCPPFKGRSYGALEKKFKDTSTLDLGHSSEIVSLNKASLEYFKTRLRWRDIFAANQIKTYSTWYRYDGSHCAIADAIKDLGGVMALYQRALDVCPSPEICVSSDIVFGYSQFVANLERQTQSVIPYFVITGYLGDHRLPFLKQQAQKVRETLQKNGAKHIVAFMDENSADDSRWHTGHEFMRVNYQFLFEKILKEKELGLVLKPKLPSTLRRRLGPLVELMDKAFATGRLFMYEQGILQGSYPPAVAALSADIAVHGCLAASTAGLECALAGVPTLLMDREGWSVSPFYQLGLGKVVFTDWDSLWWACQQHWNSPSGTPGFGDWSSMLDQLDPFRDGRAAERMGNYLKWLIDGFEAGLSREIVMADAAERYCKLWGKDKVVMINCCTASH